MVAATKLYDEVHDASEALVMAHLGMVKRVALHLKVRIPPFMELDELMQVGMIGLLEAARGLQRHQSKKMTTSKATLLWRSGVTSMKVRRPWSTSTKPE